jgi:ATP-binding cassette subfamily F protein uup
MLEDILEEWPGALVVVSHDRAFLERTTARLVAVADDGSVSEVAGGVDGWVGRITAGDPRRAGSLGTPGAATPVAKRQVGTTGAPPASTGAPIGRLLRDADKEVVRLQRQRDKITEQLTATTDHVELSRLGVLLADAQTALETAEEHWLELAESAE